jgi:hypothetical protein
MRTLGLIFYWTGLIVSVVYVTVSLRLERRGRELPVYIRRLFVLFCVVDVAAAAVCYGSSL